jgi:hypothetical protein
MMSERSSIEKMIEQELSGILLRSIKLAQKEEKPEAKATLQIILRAIDSRRSEREEARATEPQS